MPLPSFTRRLALLAAASWLTVPALAADFPERPIRLVVPYAPGGATDIAARLVAKGMADRLGQPVVVENKPGASTILAADYVAKSAADGYTLLFASGSTVVSNPEMFTKLPYTRESFTPVSMVTQLPFALTVGNGFPAKNLVDFIKLAKAKPGAYSLGHQGVGSASHIVGAQMQSQLGIKLSEIPYKGTALSLQDTISGVLDMFIDGIPTAIAQGRGKTVQVFAITANKRSPQLPDVPTFNELGYPKVEMYTTFGILAPKSTPAPVVDKVADAVQVAMKDAATRKRFEDEGYLPAGTSPAEYRRLIEQESKVWGDIIRPLNIKLD